MIYLTNISGSGTLYVPFEFCLQDVWTERDFFRKVTGAEYWLVYQNTVINYVLFACGNNVVSEQSEPYYIGTARRKIL